MTSIRKMSKHSSVILGGVMFMVPLVSLSTMGLLRRISSRSLKNSIYPVNINGHGRIYSLVAAEDAGTSSTGAESSGGSKGLFGTLWDYATSAPGAVWNATKNVISSAKDMVTGAASAVGNVAGTVASGVGTAASTAAGVAGSAASTVAGAVGSVASTIGTAASSVGSAAVQAVQAVAGGGSSSSSGKRSFWTSPWFLGTILSSVAVLSALLFFR